MQIVTNTNLKEIIVKLPADDKRIIEKVFSKTFPDAPPTRFRNIIKHKGKNYLFSEIEAILLSKKLKEVIQGSVENPVLIKSDALLELVELLPTPIPA